MMLLLSLLGLGLSSWVLASDCHHGDLHHCTCVNVTQPLLSCPPATRGLFVYQSLMSESSEVMSLRCQPGVSRKVLEDIEVSGVAGQTVSVKMVGCETETALHGNQTHTEMIRLCTPVKQVSFLSRFLNFFSFSYTYTKGQSLKELDLIGCTDMENSEDFARIKTMTNADAVALFSLDGENKFKTFKKYIYYGKYSRKNINTTTKQLKPEGLNIDLSDREIFKVNKDVFWTESYNHFEIEMLNLTFNSLSDLPLGMFPNSTFGNTKYLDLSHNQISELQSSIFENLTSVADLNLSGNRLKILSDGIFINNPLERLDLSRNLLVLLEENILSKTLNLESLDLSTNKLGRFSLKSDNNFRRLLTLNLAHNKLITMDESLRTGYPTLRFLNISYNNIGPVVLGEDLQFDKSNHGMVVDLSFNMIETLKLEEGEGLNHHHQFIYLDLQENPIKCDCTATDLKRAIDGKLSNNYFHLISDTLYCHSGNSLEKIDYSDLNCPLEEVFPDQQCRDFGCGCSLNKFYKEVTINCSSSGLTEFPMDLIELPSAEYFINLDLADNSISELPKIVNFTNYDNIKLMNFSSNNLAIIDHELLPRELRYLSLRDNNIHYLSEKTVEFLEKHINKSQFHMQLGLNPLNCNCNAEFLHNFIDSHHGTNILDRNDVFIECSGGPLQLANAQFEDFCTSIDKKLMPVIASVTTLLALLGLFGMICALNKQRILIYLYSKSWSRRFFNEEYIDKNKNYDAFISYSHEDRDYVEGTLLSGLEKATDSEFRYKVCVHSRDWNVGEDIPSQIFRSVEDSRKTIIVLSQNYIESKWSDMEFKAAHKKALVDKIQRVIIIKHGDIRLETKMFEDLENYMKMNTYLESSDPWFWPKLRYTLPHRRKVTRTEDNVFWSAREHQNNLNPITESSV